MTSVSYSPMIVSASASSEGSPTLPTEVQVGAVAVVLAANLEAERVADAL